MKRPFNHILKQIPEPRRSYHVGQLQTHRIITPYQELNVRTISKFIGLARIAENGEDPSYVVVRLVKLADEYNQRDAELPSTEKR